VIRVLAALLSGIAVDVLATLVFHFTDKNKAMLAATTNVLVTACALWVFVDVSKEHLIAVPYLIGIWVGGIIGVKLKVYLEKR